MFSLTPTVIAASIVTVLAAVTGAFFYGKVIGKHDAQMEQLAADVDAYVQREGVENDVKNLDRYNVCINLGGLSSECNELRRMEKTTETQ